LTGTGRSNAGSRPNDICVVVEVDPYPPLDDVREVEAPERLELVERFDDDLELLEMLVTPPSILV